MMGENRGQPSRLAETSRVGIGGWLLVLATAVGLLPGSLLPLIVTVARARLGFSIPQAASLGAADLYGVALGALAVALVGVPARWRTTMASALVCLAVVDLVSATQDAFVPLLALRAVRGFAGGLLVGVGYGVIGRSGAPDRLFGALLVVQFAIGGGALAILPAMIVARGAWLLFVLLAAASAIALACVASLPGDVRGTPPSRADNGGGHRLPGALLALFLAEAGHTAGSAFVLELGRGSGLSLPQVQHIAGIAGIAGLGGALAVAGLGARNGRLRPILLTTAVSALAGVLLLMPTAASFAAGALIGSLGWAWSTPLLLGFCATSGDRARAAAWAAFVAKAGLATGPLLGAAVATGGDVRFAMELAIILALASGGVFWRTTRANSGAAATRYAVPTGKH